MREKVLVLAAVALLVASPAAAHPGGVSYGLTDGFAHPFTGGDHVVTLVALGLLSRHLGRRGRWLLPSVLLGMTLGGMLASWGVALRGVEVIIAGSAGLLAATVFLRIRMTPRVVWILAAIGSVFNGHVHAAEMPAGASVLPYVFGLVCAAGVLYGSGAILQRICHRRADPARGRSNEHDADQEAISPAFLPRRESPPCQH